MNSVLLKLNQCLEEAEVIIEDLKRQKNELGLLQANLEKEYEKIDEAKKEIAQRETFVIEGEHPLKKDADKRYAEVQELLQQLREETNAFETYKKGENDRLTEIRKTNQRENDLLVENRKDIKNQIEKGIQEWVEKHIRKV